MVSLFTSRWNSVRQADSACLLEAFQQIGGLTLSSLELEKVLDNLAQQIVAAGIFRSIIIALVHEQCQQVGLQVRTATGPCDVLIV